MKKFLRLSFVALMAMVANVAMAEDVIWEESWNGAEANAVPSAINANYSEEGTGTKIYNENLAGGEAPELLIAKSNGSFTANITLGGKSGELTLTFKANYPARIAVSSATTGVEIEKNGADNIYKVTVPAATTTLALTFTNTSSSNVRFDDAKLFQGQGKLPAGLSWGTSSRTVTIDATDNVFPTLANPNNLTVTYSSSEPSVATIAADGTVTLVAAGQTVIKAEFAGNDEYEAAAVQYTLTVKEAAAPTQDITVAQALDIINALENGKTTDETYNVTGYVVGTPDFQRKDDNTLYGNVNFEIADEANGTTTLLVFRAKNIGNEAFTEETISTLKEGDKVVVFGKLQKYVKNEAVTPELTSGYLVSIEGTTAINSVKATTLNANAPIFNLAGQQVSKNYKGVVIQNGRKVILK